MKTVGQVAALAGVSVRTLHHYDERGLLRPSERSEADYRLYSYGDLARLQEILIWRQLGFTLAEIGALVDDLSYDRRAALERQRELLGHELERLGALAAAVDTAIRAEGSGTRPEEATMFDGLGPSQYEAEAHERWGHTDAYRESARRTRSYGEAECKEIRREAEEIVRDMATLMRAGEPATDATAQSVIAMCPGWAVTRSSQARIAG